MEVEYTDGTKSKDSFESVAHMLGAAEHLLVKHPGEIKKITMWPEMIIPSRKRKG